MRLCSRAGVEERERRASKAESAADEYGSVEGWILDLYTGLVVLKCRAGAEVGRTIRRRRGVRARRRRKADESVAAEFIFIFNVRSNWC